MKVRCPADCYLVAVVDDVAAGDVVDVDDEIGLDLIRQGWGEVRPKESPAPKEGEE